MRNSKVAFAQSFPKFDKNQVISTAKLSAIKGGVAEPPPFGASTKGKGSIGG